MATKKSVTKRITTRKKSPPKSKIEVNENLISQKEVEDVIWGFQQFASQLNKGNSVYPGVLNPFLISQRMQDITLNPIMATQEKLDQALEHPKENEQNLQSFSEQFEIISQPYKRLLSYLSSMLSFDLIMTPINVEKDDYGTKKYKDELKLVESFLDRFDYKKEFNIVVRELLRNEAYFGCPRFDTEQVVLQELPASPQYSKITGKWAYGFLMSFNFLWFLQPGVDLKMYLPYFPKKFEEILGSSPKPLNQYIPDLPAESRGASSWVYWNDLPVDISWVFKFNEELATRLPFFTGMFSDLLLQPLMRSLQKNINMAEASKLLTGEVPFLKETASKVKDSIAMSPDTLAKFMQLVSSALTTAIKFTAAPLENISPVSFDGDNELYSSYLKNMLATSGVNTSLIFTSETRPNILESHLSLNVDEQLSTSLYPQFNSFLNYHLNKLTLYDGKKRNFKWKFSFQGTNFFTNREERLERQTTLMQNGIILPQQIAAAVGIPYVDFKRQLEEGRSDGFVDKLTPILQAAQISANENKGGRPTKSASKLGDAGAQTQEQGSNISRGGKAA